MNSEKYIFTDESLKINWFVSEKYFSADDSVKKEISDSNLESMFRAFEIYTLNLNPSKSTDYQWNLTDSNS